MPDAVDDLDAEAHKQGSEQSPAPELLFPVNLFIKEEEHTAEQNQHAAVDLRIAVKDLRRVIAERKELADHLRSPEVRLRVRDTVARGVFTAPKQCHRRRHHEPRGHAGSKERRGRGAHHLPHTPRIQQNIHCQIQERHIGDVIIAKQRQRQRQTIPDPASPRVAQHSARQNHHHGEQDQNIQPHNIGNIERVEFAERVGRRENERRSDVHPVCPRARRIGISEGCVRSGG